MSPCPLPVADGPTGLKVLRGLARDRSLLTALALMHAHVGNVFQITMPRFQPAVVIGREAAHQVLVTDRDKLQWRSETDPVTKLLRRGVLVVDGEEHDRLRATMEPTLQRRQTLRHVEAMWRYTDQVTDAWASGERRDMLVEMRKIALLILVGTLFRVDFTPDMERLWPTIMRILSYISPGPWILWANMPRPQYRHAKREMDDYLYGIIRQRRAELAASGETPDAGDLLGQLIAAPDMTDDLIRDQLLTMLIAGHDTSTAFLAWALYLLGSHPDILDRVVAEVDAVLGTSDAPPTPEGLDRMTYTEQVTKETLRMYPPIHVGNRMAREDLKVHGYDIPHGTRVMYSIYLTHRDGPEWPQPERFCPARFDPQQHRPAFSYIPFGGGPRNCIGAIFAQIEGKVVLGRLLQRFSFELLNGAQIKPYMGATLEPKPGVMMRVTRREPPHAH
ncbi:MAG: cytochrome P450 [Anaerolineae bacterium]